MDRAYLVLIHVAVVVAVAAVVLLYYKECVNLKQPHFDYLPVVYEWVDFDETVFRVVVAAAVVFARWQQQGLVAMEILYLVQE